MRYALLLKISLLLLFFSKISFAEVTLTGTLYEMGTKKILKNVNIYILPHKLKAVTDETGKFLVENVPEGDFQFIINNSGYFRLTQNEKTSLLNYELFLEKESYEVFETVVTGVKSQRDISKKTLSQSEFLKAPGAAEDPVKAIQNLPGVANQSFTSQIVIQGSESDDTKYRINGHEVPLIFHFGGLASVVPSKAVNSVDYLSSGYGPEYGRALGGIVDLNTKTPQDDRWHGEAFLDITKVGLLTEGPLNKKSSLLVGGRISYFGFVLKKIAEKEEKFGITSAPEYTDFYLNYNYKISSKDTFNFETIVAHDSAEFIIKEGRDPKIEGDFSNNTSFYRIIPRYQKVLNEKSKFDVSLAYGKDGISFQTGNRYFDLENYTFSQIGKLEYKFSEKLTSIFGIDSQYRDFTVKIRLPSFNNQGGVGASSESELIGQVQGDFWETAFYIRNEYKFSEKLTLSPNLRLEYFSRLSDFYLMPRISTLYAFSNSLTWNIAVGNYFQPPKDGEPAKDFGNPDLVSERGIHFYSSLSKDFRKGSSRGFRLDVGVFYKTLDKLVIQTSELKSDGTPYRYKNDGKGNIYGLQFQANYDFNPFKLVTSYTFLNSEREDPIYGKYPSKFDQTHNLNLIGTYERFRWNYSMRLRFVTGGPYTPVTSSIYNADRDVYLPVRGTFYSERFDNFFQMFITILFSHYCGNSINIALFH